MAISLKEHFGGGYYVSVSGTTTALPSGTGRMVLVENTSVSDTIIQLPPLSTFWFRQGPWRYLIANHTGSAGDIKLAISGSETPLTPTIEAGELLEVGIDHAGDWTLGGAVKSFSSTLS